MSNALENDPGVYLEDSYLLGVGVTGRKLSLTVLFAITSDNPIYTSPDPSERHCYRTGTVEWQDVSILYSKGIPVVLATTDPDGSLDLGSVTYSNIDGIDHVVADWFELRFTSGNMTVNINSE